MLGASIIIAIVVIAIVVFVFVVVIAVAAADAAAWAAVLVVAAIVAVVVARSPRPREPSSWLVISQRHSSSSLPAAAFEAPYGRLPHECRWYRLLDKRVGSSSSSSSRGDAPPPPRAVFAFFPFFVFFASAFLLSSRSSFSDASGERCEGMLFAYQQWDWG